MNMMSVQRHRHDTQTYNVNDPEGWPVQWRTIIIELHCGLLGPSHVPPAIDLWIDGINQRSPKTLEAMDHVDYTLLYYIISDD